jgi:hypothetical protein
LQDGQFGVVKVEQMAISGAAALLWLKIVDDITR